MKRYVLKVILIFCLGLMGCSAIPSAEMEAKTLTLAVFQSQYGGETSSGSSDLLQWAERYHEEHLDVKIEIVNYLENYPDPYDAINQIKIEISAGKGPDMINFGSLYSPLDASCGMMADLYPFMENDESFDKQDYYYNILQAFDAGNSLYVLVPGYRIDSYATVNRDLTDLDSMNIGQLVDAYNKLDDESILFPGETKRAVFGMICYGSLENYVDWDKGICSFNGDSFKEILNFANQFPSELNWENEDSAKTVFREGRALLYPVNVDNVFDITGTRMLFGGTPTYIGYPFDSGYGGMATIADLAVGISSTSKYKEEAWEFISSLLDSGFQDNIKGLPVRVSSLEQRIADAMRAEYKENGEKVVKEVLLFDGEEPDYIYEMSAEDAETLRSVISKIEHNATVDRNLYNILLEEVDHIFNDGRSVDEITDIIQNRASIYISESKL